MFRFKKWFCYKVDDETIDMMRDLSDSELKNYVQKNINVLSNTKEFKWWNEWDIFNYFNTNPHYTEFNRFIKTWFVGKNLHEDKLRHLHKINDIDSLLSFAAQAGVSHKTIRKIRICYDEIYKIINSVKWTMYFSIEFDLRSKTNLEKIKKGLDKLNFKTEIVESSRFECYETYFDQCDLFVKVKLGKVNIINLF